MDPATVLVSTTTEPLGPKFRLDVPSMALVDSLTDAIALLASLPEVDKLRCLGGLRFELIIRSRTAAFRNLEDGVLHIGDKVAQIPPEGPHVTWYPAFRCRNVRNR